MENEIKHRSKIKRERNRDNKETRASTTLGDLDVLANLKAQMEKGE